VWLGATRTLGGVPPGGTTMMQVRAWDTAAGATYEDAAAAGFAGTLHGTSDVFSYMAPGISCGPVCGPITGLRTFALVPEPSVIVLAAIGASGILLLNRRR